jgi:hypothetical protein
VDGLVAPLSEAEVVGVGRESKSMAVVIMIVGGCIARRFMGAKGQNLVWATAGNSVMEVL